MKREKLWRFENNGLNTTLEEQRMNMNADTNELDNTTRKKCAL
jgi:hypothetical protein